MINFAMPGDFLGLQAGVIGAMRHSVEASTDMVLCVFKREEIWSVFRNHRSRAFDLTWISAVEEHFLGETVATLGQRDGLQRVAWALFRLFKRLRAVNWAPRIRCPCPFASRIWPMPWACRWSIPTRPWAELRQRKIANWARGVLEVMDPAQLQAVAMIEEAKEERRPLM